MGPVPSESDPTGSTSKIEPLAVSHEIVSPVVGGEEDLELALFGGALGGCLDD